MVCAHCSGKELVEKFIRKNGELVSVEFENCPYCKKKPKKQE